MEKTLYIIDDHKMMLNGLKTYFEMNTDWKVMLSCSTSSECLSALEAARNTANGDATLPAIIIVDVQLLGENGFTLVQKIVQDYPSVKCVMYSMYDTIGYIMQAKESGVKGYISKVASEDELLRCLETVYNGQEYFEKRVEKSLEKLDNLASFLSQKEKNVLEKILQGKSNKEISDELCVSMHTAENYVYYIYEKLGVKSRAEINEMFGN